MRWEVWDWLLKMNLLNFHEQWTITRVIHVVSAHLQWIILMNKSMYMYIQLIFLWFVDPGKPHHYHGVGPPVFHQPDPSGCYQYPRPMVPPLPPQGIPDPYRSSLPHRPLPGVLPPPPHGIMPGAPGLLPMVKIHMYMYMYTVKKLHASVRAHPVATCTCVPHSGILVQNFRGFNIHAFTVRQDYTHHQPARRYAHAA